VRLIVLGSVAIALLGVASNASAQEPEAEAEPPAAAPATAPPAAPSEAPRKTRVRVRLKREGEVADVFVERRGSWSFECRAPCTFDATAGEQGRIQILGTDDAPLEFTVAAGGTGEHDIEVDRRGKGALVAGLVAIGAGAISLALGMAIIRGAGDDDLFGEGNRTVARILLLLGGGSAVTGTVLIVTRSTAPVVVPPAVSSSRGHDETPLPIARPQLVWTVRF
jgi:hypothetical protein